MLKIRVFFSDICCNFDANIEDEYIITLKRTYIC